MFEFKGMVLTRRPGVCLRGPGWQGGQAAAGRHGQAKPSGRAGMQMQAQTKGKAGASPRAEGAAAQDRATTHHRWS